MDIVTPRYDHLSARGHFEEMVLSSIHYLIDFYALQHVNKHPPLCWQMSAAHYLAARAAEDDNAEQAIAYLTYLNQVKKDGAIHIAPLTSADTSFEKQMILKIIHDDKELGFGYCDDGALARREREKILQALAVIQDNDPDMYHEIQHYIDTIYLTCATEDGSRFMRSGTNFYMWGLVFLYINPEHTVPYYIEHLAHECGHTALNMINAYDELVLNPPDARFAAPLRIDKRPMIGLFHAFFVISRICYVFDNIITREQSPHIDACKMRFNNALAKLRETHDIIKSNALFTDVGHEIYTDICQLWQLEK